MIGGTIRTIKINKSSHNLGLRPRDPIVERGATLIFLRMNNPSDYDQQIKPVRAQLQDRHKIEAQIQCQLKMD